MYVLSVNLRGHIAPMTEAEQLPENLVPNI